MTSEAQKESMRKYYRANKLITWMENLNATNV